MRSRFKCFYLANLFCIVLGSNLVYAQKSNPEIVGDAAQLSLPIVSYLTTFVIDDKKGRNEFYKSFFTNLGVTYFLKYTVNDQRPEGHGCCSWPSGHTSVSFQSATFIFKRYGYKYGIPFYIMASYVGWSRVEAEADMHKPDDVFAGAIIGSLTAYYFTTSYKTVSINPKLTSNYIGVNFVYRH